ncbi:hypothetical protein NCS57_00627700 [Fusarium keratoplasticum]|uniref:Uncharacterized protein n=1 Tax=Fusarium keratoplasticum TaxID=1328300 RepID=A0ACC0R2V8_9HYPO|nr:hypothetical protein NCS57_00627700 [Fusarium keratoplasticum]KAI8671522.1 hypothetical protein NCS57_00627700 [Fusarium keratoplasticum]KAI8678748.1 hypothetical protein NCS55_00596900 [Fusarium keratoplasticum]
MASLARGFCLPGLRPLLAPRAAESAVLRSRLFTTSLRRAAQPAMKATRPAKTAAAAPASSVAPSQYALIKSLATKPTPTILYEGPSHFWFYFGCWTSGISLLTWTALTAKTAVNQPEGVPQWVGITFGASYLLLVSMGFYLIAKTPNIVGRIRILPAQAAKLAPVAGSPVSVGPAPIQMEVTVKRMLPLLKPKVITAPLDKVWLKSRFSLPGEYVPELKRLEMERAAEVKREALRKFDMEHLFTMPFRRMGRAVSAMFNGVKSAWTDMGFGIIRVNGKDYKVDVTQGFAHDGFRTLEKLLEIQP